MLYPYESKESQLLSLSNLDTKITNIRKIGDTFLFRNF